LNGVVTAVHSLQLLKKVQRQQPQPCHQ